MILWRVQISRRKTTQDFMKKNMFWKLSGWTNQWDKLEFSENHFSSARRCTHADTLDLQLEARQPSIEQVSQFYSRRRTSTLTRNPLRPVNQFHSSRISESYFLFSVRSVNSRPLVAGNLIVKKLDSVLWDPLNTFNSHIYNHQYQCFLLREIPIINNLTTSPHPMALKSLTLDFL